MHQIHKDHPIQAKLYSAISVYLLRNYQPDSLPCPVYIINWIPFPKINKHLTITVHTVCSGYASGPVSIFEGSQKLISSQYYVAPTK